MLGSILLACRPELLLSSGSCFYRSKIASGKVNGSGNQHETHTLAFVMFSLDVLPVAQ